MNRDKGSPSAGVGCRSAAQGLTADLRHRSPTDDARSSPECANFAGLDVIRLTGLQDIAKGLREATRLTGQIFQ
jgi:hypothetical protein